MSTPQRLILVAVALLVVLGVGALLAGAGEDRVAGGPSPGASVAADSPAATSSAEATGGTDEPSASAGPSASAVDDAELVAALQEIERQVIDIRGLPEAEIGPPDIITRAELGAELEAIFAADYPPEERERDNVMLRALGMLGPNEDVADIQLELLGDQVLGFYDDETRRMVVVSDAGLDAEAKLTYAHEYTHALQDAAFSFDALEELAGDDDDRALAHLALIEGDATATMLAWALAGNLTPEELLQLGNAQVPDTGDAPSWMVDQLTFPYTAGQAWVAMLGGQADPLSPDFDAVDAAFEDPPVSTEQIIDFGAWEAQEGPLPVPEIDLAAALGEGWEPVDATPMGQAGIEFLLRYLESEDARLAADGWGGDLVTVASGPDGATALAWHLAWDAPAEADEFVAAYEDVISELPFPASVTQLGDGEVLVAHASDETVLEAVESAASGG